jgi:succinate dehydrogenase/fumarate reductase flavoprotein subunit
VQSAPAALPDETAVVVAGAGLGGLAAALAAAEQGVDVVLLEKGREPGGSFALAGGYIWTFASREDYAREVPEGDPELGGLVVEDLDAGIEFLLEHGARLGPEVISKDGLRGRRVEPDPVSAGVLPLARALAEAGGRLVCSAQVQSLTFDDRGRVTGMTVSQPDGTRTLAAQAVVIATGGFQGNLEMMTRYISRDADRFVLRAAPASVGDGLRLALDAGAAVSSGLASFYGHLMPAPPAEIEPGAFRRLSQFYSYHTIAINRDGRRFADESRGDNHLALRLAREPGASAFLVFDSRNHRDQVSQPFVNDAVAVDPLIGVREVGGVVVEAGSLQALVEQLADGWQLSRHAVRETFAAYDAAASAGDDAGLDVPRSGNLHRLSEPPFFAVPVRPGITFTGGGVRVGRECQALHLDGHVIPGLYIAGADVGGISVEGYAGGLAAALTTGLRAGVHAALHADYALSGTSRARR